MPTFTLPPPKTTQEIHKLENIIKIFEDRIQYHNSELRTLNRDLLNCQKKLTKLQKNRENALRMMSGLESEYKYPNDSESDEDEEDVQAELERLRIIEQDIAEYLKTLDIERPRAPGPDSTRNLGVVVPRLEEMAEECGRRFSRDILSDEEICQNPNNSLADGSECSQERVSEHR